MSRRFLVAALLVIGTPAGIAAQDLRFTVDLNDRADSAFKVSLRVSGLRPENDIYQFAATAPGTYQVMNMGRFVRAFEARDANGRVIPTEKISTNQWRISDPRRTREIRYTIAETFSSPFPEHRIYPMCGSALRSDHAFINGQTVFGYLSGLQAAPATIQLLMPASWIAGTALPKRGNLYRAESYDHIVDSPILLGSTLTQASMLVTGVPVDIYTFSMGNQVNSAQLLDAMRSMLLAAGEFLGRLPVDRYTFLYYFGPQSAGAWEHSYSSAYVLSDGPLTPNRGRAITDIAAHEFFHIVTPLNLHSEIIEHFNFETPVPSQHLWLYEGTTEWAAHKMQLEAGLRPADDYLSTVIQKQRIDRQNFDTTYSLAALALTSYSDSGQRQFGNIYQRGAVVAGLLDIELLDMSNGTRDLADLIASLTRRYGKNRAFPEDSLVAIIAATAGGRVTDFFRRYLHGTERPPIREYYGRLGFRLIEDAQGNPLRFEPDPGASERQLLLRQAWLGRRGVLTRAAAPAAVP